MDLPFCSLRRGEGRRLAAEASSFSPPVALEVSVERLDVALVLAEGVREIGVASPVARGALGVRVLVLGVARARAIELPLAPTLRHAFLVGCDWRELGRRRVNPPREVPLGALVFEDFAGQDAHARRGGRQGERGEAASFHLHVCACRATKEARRVSRPGDRESAGWRRRLYRDGETAKKRVSCASKIVGPKNTARTRTRARTIKTATRDKANSGWRS